MPLTRVLERSAVLAWVLIATSWAGLAWMMSDSAPPFKLVSYTANAAGPGEAIRVEAIVERDLTRDCSVTFSRHIFDSSHTRIDLVAQTAMTKDAVDGLEKQLPGKLRLSVLVPQQATPGPARLVTPLSYVCNLWHSFRPIEMTMEMDVEILPDKPKP